MPQDPDDTASGSADDTASADDKAKKGIGGR